MVSADRGHPGRAFHREDATARQVKGLAGIEGARRRPLPARLGVELATLVREAPAGDEWLHETKYDGYRLLCRLDSGRVRLRSRNGTDWTLRLPDIAAAARRVRSRGAWLDGELVAFDEGGRTSFQSLQLALGTGSGRLAYFVFDLLYFDGYDLRAVRLEERKEVLRSLLARSGASLVRYSPHVMGGGPRVRQEACRKALEGIVSKRRDSRYRPGRTRDWLKSKCQGQPGVRHRRLHGAGRQPHRPRGAASRSARRRGPAGPCRPGGHGLQPRAAARPRPTAEAACALAATLCRSGA